MVPVSFASRPLPKGAFEEAEVAIALQPEGGALAEFGTVDRFRTSELMKADCAVADHQWSGASIALHGMGGVSTVDLVEKRHRKPRTSAAVME